MCEGALLICTARGAYVAKVAGEARLGILHHIPRPPDVRDGCLPYASWRLIPQPPSACVLCSALQRSLLLAGTLSGLILGACLLSSFGVVQLLSWQ